MNLFKHKSEGFISQNFSFLDLDPVGAFIIKDDCSVLFWNSCLERWTGINREDILHKSILDFFPVLKNEKYSSRINSIFKGGPPVIFSSKFHKYLIPCPLGDGTFQTQQTMITSIQDEENDKVYALFTLQDLTDASRQVSKFKSIKTELAKKEKELQGTLDEVNRVNKELEQFAYVVSHDLKAPLRGINHLAEWIKEDLSENLSETTEKYLKKLQDRVYQLDQMIDGIFEYSMATGGSIEMQQVDLEMLFNEIKEELIDPTKFSIEFPDDLPKISSHRTKLKQIFSNLISNSIKHYEGIDGRIIILASEGKDFYEFIVKDNGPGIDPAYHEKIFQIFNIIPTKKDSKKNSTGIGLTIVKKLVNEFGGNIELDLEIGKGTCFKFTHRKF
ncbi:MAG: ATP-binding protein [Nitrospinota bacterium]